MQSTVLLVTNHGIGKADEELQLKLAAKYFGLLLEHSELPNAICFYTEGVKLVCEGSPLVDQLRGLEAKGTRLIVCSTCLEYFKLSEKVQVGIVAGMPDIIEAQVKADKVITL